MSVVWDAWSAEWVLNNKCSFDGITKVIHVHPDVTTFNIRTDLYSEWIDWISLYDNLKFLPAVRVTGLDPIGAGVYTGDVYFLINGWKLSVNLQRVRVTGVLYSDDYDTAYYTESITAQYPATVSALVNTVSIAGGSGATPAEVWAYNNRSLTSASPSAVEIRAEIDLNSTKLSSISTKIDTIQTSIPTTTAISNSVWSKPISELSDKTTIGGYISKVLLSVPKFLGLK